MLLVTIVGLLDVLFCTRGARAECRGDCGGDGAVSVDEIVTLSTLCSAPSRSIAASPAMNGVFNSVWGPVPGDVYAGGGPTGVAHFDGQQWSTITSDLFGAGTFFPIWGFDPQDIFFGLIHYDAVEFVNTRDPESRLFDVSGLWGPPDGSSIYGASRDGVWQLER